MRFLATGPTAVLVELNDLDQVLALEAEVARRRAEGWAPGLVEVVPGARTLLFDGIDRASLARELPGWRVPPAAVEQGPAIEIACTYDGPDLEVVARQWRIPSSEVVAVHTSLVHTVAFCGFAPGFAYLAGIGEQRSVARRPSPRTAVPAGSVALGGPYTGIYPQTSPGGWQVIGHTDTAVWDPARTPPALLHPRQRVRFVDAGA